MTDMQIIGWLIAIFAFAAGFGLGHGCGQIAGINWCIKRDEEFEAMDKRVREIQASRVTNGE